MMKRSSIFASAISASGLNRSWGTTMREGLPQVIDRAWDERESLGPQARGEVRDAVEQAVSALDSGEARVAEPDDAGWTVNQWLKKAVLLSFRLNPMEPIAGGPGGAQ